MPLAPALSEGFVRLPRWWWSACKYDGGLIELLVALATFDMKGDGVVFPSQKTLADLIGKSRQYVNRKLGELVDIGLINKTTRRHAAGGDTSCSYEIAYDRTGNRTDAEAEMTTDSALSSPVTPGVTEDDTKDQKTKNITHLAIENWEVSEASLSALKGEACEEDALRFVARFKERVASKGYRYADLDAALMQWWAEDREKKRGGFLKRTYARVARSVAKVTSDEVLPADLPDLAKAFEDAALEAGDRIRAGLAYGAELGSPAIYANWLKRLELVSAEDAVVTLRAPTRYHRDYVLTHHLELIMACLHRAGVTAQTIEVVS